MQTPKLCDLGWAAVIRPEEMKRSFCGTLDYVSPEMKDSGLYDHSVDLWSLGVLTFEMIAGFAPFQSQISHWKLKGSNRKEQWSWEVLYPPSIPPHA